MIRIAATVSLCAALASISSTGASACDVIMSKADNDPNHVYASATAQCDPSASVSLRLWLSDDPWAYTNVSSSGPLQGCSLTIGAQTNSVADNSNMTTQVPLGSSVQFQCLSGDGTYTWFGVAAGACSFNGSVYCGQAYVVSDK